MPNTESTSILPTLMGRGGGLTPGASGLWVRLFSRKVSRRCCWLIVETSLRLVSVRRLLSIFSVSLCLDSMRRVHLTDLFWSDRVRSGMLLVVSRSEEDTCSMVFRGLGRPH